MIKLVLLRHGQSVWNLENRFTGWVDVDLSERGIREAREAGQILKAEGYSFDVAITSYLKRSIRTLWLVLEEIDQMYLPVETDWRLNERHYGALQGLNKKEMVKQHGEEQVYKWRRGYAVQPPPLAKDDPEHPSHDPRYRDLQDPPGTESLADTLQRVTAWWEESAVAKLHANQRLLVVAHGNSLRALVKYLDNVSDEEIMKLNIPTGIPLVYELDDQLKPVNHYYLGDPEKLQSAVQEVANQAAVAQESKKKTSNA